MVDDEPKLLIYFEGEQHLVRRLGAAVVSCWEQLDEATRHTLIERAKRVLDDEGDEELADHVQGFLTMHDGCCVRAPAA